MAPTLFSMMFSAMLTDAFQDVDAGFPMIRYRFDGKLLNLRRLQAKSKVQTDVVDKLLYADDLAENAKSEETSSPKGNDAHLRAIIQSEKKWKHQFFQTHIKGS